MSSIIYSKMEGKNDPFYGKFEHPIKMLIENESDACEKRTTILEALFNIEKSGRYAETIIGQSDFEDFKAVKEGQRGENDSVEATFKKTIEHIAFMKSFTITREMADDAKFGMGANMKNAPRRFVRAYYKTRVNVAAQALINSTLASARINGAKVDLTCKDGLPLFSKNHPFALEKFKGKKQSNYFYGSLTSSGSNLEEALGALSNIQRNFLDDNGDSLEYVADYIILPCNRPRLETLVKKVVGSERTVGSHDNDINTQYGNWTVVVLPNWRTNDDRFMIMSKEANESLMGNMFYNRVKLDIQNKVDFDTRNFLWNGYCRFGVGFNAWEHMILAVNSTDAIADATALTIS